MKKEKKSAYAEDALTNALTGMGTLKDPKTANEWVKQSYNPVLIDTVYSENWLARACVDIPANEVCSKWREICTPGMTPEQIKLFSELEKSKKIIQKYREALRLARKHGGSAIYMAIEGQNLLKPVDFSKIKKDAKLNLIVFSRNELQIETLAVETDEFSENFGEPLFFRIKKSQKKIHVSHFLFFRGPGAPEKDAQSSDERFWGRSVLDSSLITAIERCESSIDSLDRSLEQATVDVLKVPDLFSKLADPEATILLRKRIAEGAMTKSVYKIALVDMNEDFQRAEATGSLSAGAEVVRLMLQVPSGATGIPVTKLLGISPGGLNATGESDSENYYGMLDGLRQNDIEPPLNILDQIICMIVFGTTFADWGYKWESFWSTNKTEDSTVEANRVNGLVALVQNHIMPEFVALRQLLADGTYSALTEKDVKDLEDFEDDEPTDGENINENNDLQPSLTL